MADDLAKTFNDGPARRRPTRHKAWQQLWLDKRREAMVQRLQSLALAIVDRLVQEGHMNPTLDEAYQFVVSPSTLPIEKARRLVDSLRSGSQEMFEAFQAALVENDCGELVARESDVIAMEEHMSSLTPFERCSLVGGFPKGVLEARRHLHCLYSDAVTEVHMLADVTRSSDSTMRVLDDVFVNIGLVSCDEVERLCSEWNGKDGGVDEVLALALRAREVALCDLLKSERQGGKDPVRVAVVGTAGSGKSFAFTLKATFEWCGGHFWKKLALLRTIRCRDKSVWRAKSVTELFQLGDLGLCDAEEAQVKEFIAKNSSQVGLVCDGLDEGRVNEGSFLWRVMTGQSLRGLHVIVTSRPCRALSDLSRSGGINRHVQMTGFSDENVEVFATRYLGVKQGGEMLSQLSNAQAVSSLMHTPFFALLVCEQFKETRQLPRRRTDIFTSVTLRVLQRFTLRRGITTSFKTLEKAPANVYSLVLEVGKVAFARLKRKDLTYFELEEEDLSTEAMQLGFLEHVQASSLCKGDQYGFRHLTLQEFLAALYVSKNVLKNVQDIEGLVRELGCGPEAGHLNTFWVFTAGLLEESLCEELFRVISRKERQTVAEEERESRGASFFEVHMAASTPVEWHDRNGGRQLQLEDEGTGCRRHVHEENKPLNAYRFILLLQCYTEARKDRQEKPSLCLTNILTDQGIALHGYSSLSLSDMHAICETVKHHRDDVLTVDMGFCHLNDDGLQQLLESLQSCSSLKMLNISANRNLENHMASLSRLVANNSKTVERLDLSYTRVDRDGPGLGGLAEALQKVKRLEQLKLQSCNLSPRSITSLSAVIKQQPALTVCCVGCNYVFDPGFSTSLSPALQLCQNLEKLHLDRIGVTCVSSSISALALLLTCLPRLNDLSLSYNPIENQGFVHLTPALQHCPQLRCLRLSYCGLTSDGPSMALLVSVILCLPSIERFCLSGNWIGDVGLDRLSVGLEECSKLTVLRLESIRISSEQSFVTVGRLLRKLHRLAVLRLSGNMFSGSRTSSASLCDAVRKHPSLKKLSLPAVTSRNALKQFAWALR